MAAAGGRALPRRSNSDPNPNSNPNLNPSPKPWNHNTVARTLTLGFATSLIGVVEQVLRVRAIRLESTSPVRVRVSVRVRVRVRLSQLSL